MPVNEIYADHVDDIPDHVPDRNGIVSMAVFSLLMGLLLLLVMALAMAA
jgi:hypothetical protein